MTRHGNRTPTRTTGRFAPAAWAFPVLALTLAGAALASGKRADTAASVVFVCVPLAFGVVGAAIVARRPANGIGWLFCMFSIGIPAEEFISARLAAPGSLSSLEVWAAWVSYWLWAPTLAALVTYLPLTFPHGRVRGRGATLILAGAAVGAAMIVLGNALAPGYFADMADTKAMRVVPVNPTAVHGHARLLEALTAVGPMFVGIAMVASITSLVRRFRRAAGTQRQQLKWFVFALCIAAVALLIQMVLYESGRETLAQAVFGAGFVWLPVAIGLAIFRHGLYDIDRIISRTVGWALVTVVIGAMYLALVTILTSLSSRVAGDSPLAVAASTLAAAAAFGSVRSRIQDAVDRRFNRARYDAVETIDSYRVWLRNELELDSVAAGLRTAVTATLQPRTTVVWLRTPRGGA